MVSKENLGWEPEDNLSFKTSEYQINIIPAPLPPADEFEWEESSSENSEAQNQEKISISSRVKALFAPRITYCKQQLEIFKEDAITFGLNVIEKNFSPASQKEIRRIINAGNGIVENLRSFEAQVNQQLEDSKNHNLDRFKPVIEEIVKKTLEKAAARMQELQPSPQSITGTEAFDPNDQIAIAKNGDPEVQGSERHLELYQKMRSIESDFRHAQEVDTGQYHEDEAWRLQAKSVQEDYGIKNIQQFVMDRITDADKMLSSGEEHITSSSFYVVAMQLYEMHDPKIQLATLALLEKHADHFTDPYDPEQTNLTNALIRFGNTDQRRRGSDRAKLLLESAMSVNEMQQGWNEPRWYEDGRIQAILIQLLRYGEPDQVSEAKDYLTKFFEAKEKNGETKDGLYVMCSIAADDKSDQVSFIGRDLLCERLSRYGVDMKKITRGWALSGSDVGETMYRNVEAMLELEEVEPGISAYLTKQCGICDFDRYPRELLLEQFRSKDDIETPYGVIIFPRADWNGAFYEGKEAFNELHGKLGNQFRVRVVECDTKVDIARQLIKLNKEYGQISFGILGGHGSPTSIQFGGSDPQHVLRMRDLRGEGAQRLNEFFRPNAEISLLACSTGAERGIGKRLSEVTGTKISAPRLPTNIATYNITIEDGTVQFNAKYTNGVNTATFGDR